jgi:hypothetical protein
LSFYFQINIYNIYKAVHYKSMDTDILADHSRIDKRLHFDNLNCTRLSLPEKQRILKMCQIFINILLNFTSLTIKTTKSIRTSTAIRACIRI